MRKYSMTVVAVLITIGTLGTFSQARTEEAVIKKVMKEAMKGGLLKKVADGKADEKQKKELLELLEALGKAKPPKGSDESWKTKTESLVLAAHEAVDGKAAAGASLKKASNCKACHDVHKGK